jgi:hypothetical protein
MPAVVRRGLGRLRTRRAGRSAEREVRRRGEGGGVGRVLGLRAPDERDAEPGDGHRQGGADHHQPEHHERHRAALAPGAEARHAVHRSTRIVDVACSSGSGNSFPTRGRFVTDR